MIVGGWDPERGGQIYGVPIGGTLVEQAWTTDGSGSTYIWGYLDAAYRYVCSIPHMLAFSRCIAHVYAYGFSLLFALSALILRSPTCCSAPLLILQAFSLCPCGAQSASLGLGSPADGLR